MHAGASKLWEEKDDSLNKSITKLFVEQPLASPGSESVPRLEEGSTGKYQHKVEGTL